MGKGTYSLICRKNPTITKAIMYTLGALISLKVLFVSGGYVMSLFNETVWILAAKAIATFINFSFSSSNYWTESFKSYDFELSNKSFSFTIISHICNSNGTAGNCSQ